MHSRAAAVAVVCLTALAATRAASAQPLAFSRADYDAAGAPRAIASADFNGDGWADIATAGTARDSVAILVSNGSAGGFRALPERMLGGGPFELAAGDLNRDGRADLVVANADADAVDILIGAGDGTFASSSRVPIAGGNPRGVAIGDYDRDGILDIIVTEYATGAWRVLYGNGAGAIARQDRFGGIKNVQGVVAADFNRDGRLDLALAGAGINIVAVIYTTANGGIEQRNVMVRGAVNVLAAGDFNRDGWLDLAAVSTSNSEIYTLHGSSTGLTAVATLASPSSPRGIAAADLNQDGRLDLVTGGRASSTVNVHLGTASGGFGSARQFGAGSGSRAVVVADFDHDGRVDVASANELASGLTVLSNDTAFVAPAFRFSHVGVNESPNSGGSGEQIRLADFDRDGRTDVLVSTPPPGGSAWGVILANGAFRSIAGSSVSDLEVSDVNRDGAPDVVTVDYWSRTIALYLNRGDATFTAAPRIASTTFVYQVAAGDFNGDGKPDIAVSGSNPEQNGGLLHIYVSLGDGRFAAHDSSVSPFLNQLSVGDVDGDGRLDIAGSSQNPAGILLWYGRGNGTANRLQFLDMPLDASDIELADVNEDGRLDLISAKNDQLMWRLSTPDGGFAAPQTQRIAIRETSFFVFDVGVGDVNLDGHVDVLTNDADVAYGNGDGTFRFDRLSTFAGYAESPLVFDVNRDGLPDLMFADGGGYTGLINERGGANRMPAVDGGRDITSVSVDLNGDDTAFVATASDPDMHEILYEWRNEEGAIVSRDDYFAPPRMAPGRYTFTVTAFDGRGGQASDTVVLTVTPYQEIYFNTRFFHSVNGAWRAEDDASAASGQKLRHPNAGAPKQVTALAHPTDYVEASFPAEPGETYKLWIRLKADGNSFANDSVFVQFYGATAADGTPIYERGTTSALAVNLEECNACGVSGWGWEDDGWGAKDRLGTALLRFPQGFGLIRIQTREDGVSIDQVVLSSVKYRTTRPGTAKNDTTILEPTVPVH